MDSADPNAERVGLTSPAVLRPTNDDRDLAGLTSRLPPLVGAELGPDPLVSLTALVRPLLGSAPSSLLSAGFGRDGHIGRAAEEPVTAGRS